MTTVQERLQLKRVPLDKWSIREQLCLASAVACSGDQNWMSVSRSLKMMCGTNRPSDWFSQKSCAAQYGKLLENADTPKRKKRSTDKEVSSWNTVETPSESILRKLTQERMAELNKLLQDEQREYAQTKEEIQTVKTTTDEANLREMWKQIDAEEKQREKEEAQHAQWLKEREDRKIELERAWRPATHLYNTSSPSLSPAPSPLPTAKPAASDDMDIEEIKTGTSPLLTSLLKSPSTSSSTHSTNATSSIIVPSSRVVAPTITNLLTGSAKPSLVTSSTPAPVFPKLMLNPSLTGPPPYEHTTSYVAPAQSPSQAAPTLSMLLENKSRDSATNKNTPTSDSTPKYTIKPISNTENTSESAEKIPVGSPNKDEDDQQLMDVFNTLIPDNIDELADILTDNNAIILNPDLLAEAEESILESVESLMAEQMDSEVFEQALSNQASMPETISTAELMEQLTSTSGFPISSTSTVKGDASPAPNDTSPVSVAVIETLEEDPEATLDGSKTSPQAIEVSSKDDDQSDFSNDAPLSELFKDKSKYAEQKSDSVQTAQEDVDEDEEADSPKERTDVFESDSNDDKCLEIIKREIHELTGLKENESSDNSSEAPPKPVESSTEKVDEFSKPMSSTNIQIKESVAEVGVSAETKVELVESENILSIDTAVKTSSSEADKVVETPECNAEIEETALLRTGTHQTLSTNSSDVETPFEDAKDDLQEEDSTTKRDHSINIDDTDDESVISHDEKPMRSKRDYTRRKIETPAEKTRPDEPIIIHPDETSKSSIIGSRMRLKDRDRSESPYVDDGDADSTHSRSKRRYSSTPVLDSMPNSPASSNEDNREYRAWKRSIFLVLNKLALHKHWSHFQKPITEEQAPGYKDIVLRPMDLQTLKRNVEAGLVRTTAEFQRDIMLMCSNAIMYNSDDETARSMARQLESDALQSIDIIMEAWRKEHDKTIGGGASSSHIGRSVASPVPATVTLGSTATSSKPVRGRKSHRVSAGQQQTTN